MTTFLTCRDCAKRYGCTIKDSILAAISGLRVTTVRHTCRSHEPIFRRGQAVWVKVQQRPYSIEDGYYDDAPSKEWFPAHFLETSSRSKTRGLVFVATGAKAREGNAPFYPIGEKEEGAVCKLPWASIEPRSSVDAVVCPTCKQLGGMKCEGAEIGPPCPMVIGTHTKAEEDRA